MLPPPPFLIIIIGNVRSDKFVCMRLYVHFPEAIFSIWSTFLRFFLFHIFLCILEQNFKVKFSSSILMMMGFWLPRGELLYPLCWIIKVSNVFDFVLSFLFCSKLGMKSLKLIGYTKFAFYSLFFWNKKRVVTWILWGLLDNLKKGWKIRYACHVLDVFYCRIMSDLHKFGNWGQNLFNHNILYWMTLKLSANCLLFDTFNNQLYINLMCTINMVLLIFDTKASECCLIGRKI